VSEPPPDSEDYRFSLANERTFLAWVRTALALLAAGIAVVNLPPRFSSHSGREVLGVVLIALGTIAAAGSFLRWRAIDRAIKRGAPLPVSRGMPVIAVGMTAVAVLALVLVLTDL
jgi:putative membrane protein